MRRIALVAVPACLPLLSACTEQDAAGFERAVDSFFVSILQFFLVMMLIAAFFFVLWALIFAGAATAVIAGIKRLRDRRDDEPARAPAPDPDALQAAARADALPPAPPGRARAEPDWLAVGMIIFGVVLLLGAAPTVFAINLGPTSAGSVTIPMPLILAGAALVGFALRRRKQPEPPPPDNPADPDT